jgi:hypothetical protein
MDLQKLYDNAKNKYEQQMQAIKDTETNLSSMKQNAIYLKGVMDTLLHVSETLKQEKDKEIND